MEEKHKAVLPVNFKKRLPLQLKNSTARGKLINQGLVQAPGGREGEIRSQTAAVSKPKSEKKTKTTSSGKKPGRKKSMKSMKQLLNPPQPSLSKQPKSIKSFAAKKSMKQLLNPPSRISISNP
ncbi:hypothetical protein COP1_044171 [Malus domestica]